MKEVEFGRFNSSRYDENKKLRNLLEADGFNGSEIVLMNNITMFENPDIINMGVNCAATGTMSVKKSEAFARCLCKAAEMARDFIYNGYEII